MDFVAFGNEELKRAPAINVGDTVPCPKCGESCVVQDSKPGGLQYTKCTAEHVMLVGLDGKDVRKG